MADTRKKKKLHELLAVESPLKAQAEKTRRELATTFEKKRHLFTEKSVTFRPLEEGKEPVREEQLDLQSTVRKELTWIAAILASALDAEYQVQVGNTQAFGDVLIEGTDAPLLTHVPATALLSLEKRVNELREFVLTIPTLDPAKGFVLDEPRGKNIYRARDDVRPRTKKTSKALVLYEATKEHPAQVKEISVDEPIGTLLAQEWSGLITTSEKADMMDRVERLGRAVKTARTRANEVEVDPALTIGEVLLSYVFGS